MRRARVTYKEAYHHVMNRGIGGEKIFPDASHKKYFMKLLKELIKKFKIDLYAYCIMDNHYHLVIKVNQNNLSAFMKELNGTYGLYYRRRNGGKGYVFQSRFKSTLIENDSYLIMAIVYTILNSVRAGIVNHAVDYEWSSAKYYFSEEKSDLVCSGKVEEMFGSKEEMETVCASWNRNELPVYETRVGSILGTGSFQEEAVAQFNRRKEKIKSSLRIKRDRELAGEKMISDFEKKRKLKLKEIDFTKHAGKRIRGELLVFLRDVGCLTYKEISGMEFFTNLQMSSLGRIYKNSKK